MNTITVVDTRNKRRRMRRIEVDRMVERAYLHAGENGCSIITRHGGTVPNKYNYPAVTDAVVVVVIGETAVVWAREIPANKATLSGVLARCIGEEARAMLDDRCGEERRTAAREHIYAIARLEVEKAMTPA